MERMLAHVDIKAERVGLDEIGSFLNRSRVDSVVGCLPISNLPMDTYHATSALVTCTDTAA
jgi:phospholipid N-methyltransferase